MVKIGSNDIDTYIRTLVSQGLDHQPKKGKHSSRNPEKGTHDDNSSNRIKPNGIREEA